ncbi:hypothetical protein KA050_03820 [Candidatus Gracilibacteria bacterium]|nr:hypothetical protein [Candidatus Gracilibacteria bacterium]
MKQKIILFCCILFTMRIFAECQSTNDPKYDTYSTGMNSYECNVKNKCTGKAYGGDAWNFNTDKKLIIKHDATKYPNLQETGAGLAFEDLRAIYHETQNKIMNCAVLKSKFTLHKKIIDDYKISEKAKEILKKANDIIEKQMTELGCEPPRNGDKIYNYKDLLDSMSYEHCGYNMYLWYYSASCDGGIGSCIGNNEPQSALEVALLLQTQGNKIANEYDLASRTMDTALSLYENFEKTYIAHVLLEMMEAELTEDKRYMGVTVNAIMQWLSLARNAQKQSH